MKFSALKQETKETVRHIYLLHCHTLATIPYLSYFFSAFCTLVSMISSSRYPLLILSSKLLLAPIRLQPAWFMTDQVLTHISLASRLWDIGKLYSPRCDAAERGVPSGAILIAQRNFIEKRDKKIKITPNTPINEKQEKLEIAVGYHGDIFMKYSPYL